MAENHGETKAAHQAPPKEPVNLRRVYPIAYRSMIRRSIHWIVAFALLVVALTLIDHLRPATGSMSEQVFYFFGTAFFVIALGLLLLKLLYEVVYYHVYYYGTELEHFIISRGIFYKTRSSFPIARIADVYLERTPLDLVFMLYNLRVTTPSPVVEHGSIEGLSFKRASELQNYLLALVNTTTPASDEEVATDALRALKATEDPSIFGASPEHSDPPRSKPEVLPLEEQQAPPAEDPKKVLAEIDRTEQDLKRARAELAHAGAVLHKARETIEKSNDRS